jgi:RecA-family ATPase
MPTTHAEQITAVAGAADSSVERPHGTLMHPDEWVSQRMASPPAIVDSILPAQGGEYILVAGRTGIGKSILMLNLLYAIGTGTPFLGYGCERTSAGMLIMEGDRANIQNRIRKVKEQYPATESIALDFRLDMKPLERNLEYYVETFGGCRVVMLDNLKQVTTSERLKNEYASNWLATFQRFLRDINAVGILTHHVRKQNANSLIEPGDVYELKGAGEYVEDASTVILLERERQQRGDSGQFLPVDPNRVTLYFAKHRIATRTLEPIRLERNYETAGFDILSS